MDKCVFFNFFGSSDNLMILQYIFSLNPQRKKQEKVYTMDGHLNFHYSQMFVQKWKASRLWL